VLSAPAVVTVAIAASPLLDALVSYWSFDHDWTDSHGTNDLTNVNGVTSAAGKLGNAGDFESSSAQYLSHPDPTPLGDEDFTYACWFKRESMGRVQLIAKDAETGRSYFLQISPDDLIVMTFGSDALGVNRPIPADLNWHYVIVWHDAAANTLSLQVDDGGVGTQATGGIFPALNPAIPVRIGARQYTGFQDYFDGLIDDVGLWRRVLTAEERTALYNGGLGLAYPFTPPVRRFYGDV
jgi:hypothetical protein